MAGDGSPTLGRPYAVGALVFAVLALGPRLHLLGRTVFTVFRVTVPLPYALFYYLPLIAITRTPARFVFLALMALAVLAALGTARLVGQIAPRHPRWAAALVAALIALSLAEHATGFTLARPEVPAIYAGVIADPDDARAVFELPHRPTAHYYIAQVAHRKPQVGGFLARPVANPLIDQNAAAGALALARSPAGTEADLVGAGIGYVVVNWWLVLPEERAPLEAALAQVFGRAPDAIERAPDGGVRISLYQLER